MSTIARRAALAAVLAAVCAACGAGDPANANAIPHGSGEIDVEVVAAGLNTPWTLAWGPQGQIWFTERGSRVGRVDPATGTVTELGQLQVHQSGESGLMGMVLHPDFPAEPWIYLAHTYTDGGVFNRLVRVRYENDALGPPQVLVDGIPGASFHDGSRLAFGPDGFLYMTTGDAGDQAAAQQSTSLAGKVLRFTDTGAAAPGNPLGGPVWSKGHRNPQGLAFGLQGRLYSSEHGPDTDDEVNLLRAGGNFGWPEVRGFCDGSGEADFCQANDVVEPLAAWTPTLAVAGTAYYGADLLPGWQNSLLVATLKAGVLLRLQLSADGTAITGQEQVLTGYGRLRAVLVAPDGSVYVSTSNRDGRGSPAAADDRILRITR